MQYLKASAITLKYFLKVMRVRVDTIQHFHASKILYGDVVFQQICSVCMASAYVLRRRVETTCWLIARYSASSHSDRTQQ